MSIFDHFKHLDLSPGQVTALEKLEVFLDGNSQVFMLKGYAGSGKTTIIKGLVEHLASIEKSHVLMAPTGRAAKVIRERTGQEAYTIHKSIYSFNQMEEVEEGDSFFYYYKIRSNVDVSGKVFIVDEASMISDAKSEGEFFRFGTGHLLTDLVTYTRSNIENVNSKIIFVGDPCQLPPVGDSNSKAFDLEYLKNKFQLSVEETEMKEVKRQEGESGILKASAKIRRSISSGYFNNFSLRSNNKDIINPVFEEFLDIWQQSPAPKIIIASKNKTCLDLNLQIRAIRFGNGHLPIQQSDIIIIGGNNYRKGVLNGEFAVVNEVSDICTIRTISLKGKNPVTLRWRDIELLFPDNETSNKIVKGKVLENFLYGDNYLNPEETQALYVDFKMRHKNLKPKTDEFKEAIINDDYFNCLLIKYGYAVTCHKAQGGEWDHVFTVWDQDNRDEFDCFVDKQIFRAKDNEYFFRWAYTAVTRASKKLYALNPPFFNSYSVLSFIEDSVLKSLAELTGQQIQAEEISLDDDLLEQLSCFKLLDQPLPIQDHFIKVRHAVRKQYIEIISWEKKNLEVFYMFKRESQLAGLKTWINSDNRFNGKFQKLQSNTNSEELYKIIESLLKCLPNVTIKRDTAETILSQIEFDIETEEKYPFTRSLFDDLVYIFEGTGIIIDNLQHQQYKERYTFKRKEEKAVIDFEYNRHGFFGRVVPLQKASNSLNLISDIQAALQTFKMEENAG